MIIGNARRKRGPAGRKDKTLNGLGEHASKLFGCTGMIFGRAKVKHVSGEANDIQVSYEVVYDEIDGSIITDGSIDLYCGGGPCEYWGVQLRHKIQSKINPVSSHSLLFSLLPSCLQKVRFISPLVA